MIHTYVAVVYSYSYAIPIREETRSMIVDYPVRTSKDMDDLQKDIYRKFKQECPVVFMKEFEDS